MTAKLNLNFANFASGLRSASAQASKFAANLNGKINSGMTDPVRKAKFEFKDVARIVQGIIISKIFYSSLNAIRSATDAVWEFSKSLEYAKISYTNLFGDEELAQEFINVLKDFAAVTPFTFEDSEAAAKRLLAYGIQYKNVMYIMQGILSASTMQGNSQAVESVSRALGQIYTKGRLMNEEMRQLAEAGIPAYEILSEKLGLTNDQLRNLGNNAIPANVAINALIDGMNERFGGVLAASSKTITGILSNIKDNALMLFSNLFDPFTQKVKSVLDKLGTFLATLREASETGGVGAVFEKLIPPELLSTVRTLIANLMNLWSIVKSLLVSAWQIFGQAILGVVQALNVLLPIINAVLGVLAALLQAIASNKQLMNTLIAVVLAAATAWAVYKVHALAAIVTTAVIKAIIVAVKALVVALNFVVAHPVWALLSFGLGLLVALSGAAGKLGQAIRGIFTNLTSIGGINPDSLLLPSQEERANDLDKFNERLGDTSSAMDDLADSTGKATKAAKGLLSFDEVFKLNQPDEGAGSGGAYDFGDWDFGDLGGGLGSGMIPDLEDFDLFSSSFVDTLLESLGGKERLLGAGIGTILGGALGGILGGPLGTKIGMVVGAIAGWFWSDLAEALGLTDAGTIALPIATVLGTAVGFIVGGPLGAGIGAAIGALVGWLVDSISRTIETGDWSSMAMPIGIGLGAAIGMIAGGPVGAAIGAAIGAVVGWIVDLFADNWEAIGAWCSQAAKDLGQAFSDIGTWFGNVGKSIGTFFSDLGTSISTGFTNVMSQIGLFFENLWISISTWFTNAIAGIQEFFATLWANVLTWFSTLIESVTNFFATLWTSATTWFDNTLAKISEFFTSMWSRAVSGLSNIVKEFTSFFSNVLSGITRFGSNAVSGFVNFFSNLLSGVKQWTSIIYNTFRDWLSNLWDNVFSKFFGWVDDGISKLKQFLGLNSGSTTTTSSSTIRGHATGGIFNKEHIARFAENNKAEAIIPLENQSAMQPFVDAISNGIVSSLMPLVAAASGNSGGDQRTPVSVGVLIADDRGLKELQRRMNIIQVEEENRRG